MTTPIIRSTALAVMLAVGATIGAASIPQRASANSTTTIAIAAAAIVGALLVDSSNRPYYVRNNHRYYVSAPVAQYYYQRQDPTYYRAHQSQWNSNRQQFAQGWQQNHKGGRGNGHSH
jgi:hypothetical protein